MSSRPRDFLIGMSAGVVTSALVSLLVVRVPDGAAALHAVPVMTDAFGLSVSWLWHNLGYSIPAFLMLLVLFAVSLVRLRHAIDRRAPAETVRQADHLSDIWTSLFFGVGVIWTAIGMRGALVEGLSDSASGGVQVLERMVDGGILLALSTTIVGGIGGYLMRAWKALSIGADLARYYEREQNRDLAALRVSVSGIERRLATPETRAEER
ncbi:MAG: hypothetical protein JSW21_11545 [Gammaproteobacteria bacterium]|nr:MAG: hypothetical protein JSW21_11545 [Gammaproteobacteria bacterium]